MTSRSSPGYIGPNLVIRGRLSGEGGMHIDGRLEGDLAVQGDIIIGAPGAVRAAVRATRLVVAGVLRGPVLATDEVTVSDGGRLDGDVRAPRVAVDDGGVLHGGIDMEFDLPDQPTEEP